MERKLKVLMVIPGAYSGSSMIFSRRQMEALTTEGVDCQPFFLTSRQPGIKLLNEMFRFRKALKKFNPDIIHSQYGTMTAFFSAFLSSKRLVITFHGSDLNVTRQSDGFITDLLGRILSNLASLKASSIICVNKAMIKGLWWRRSNAIVIPVGVSTEKFYPIDYSEARKKMGWIDSERIIVFNANNPKIKRLDLALQATAILKQQKLCVRLEILDGKTDPEMIPVYLNASDCLLLCSDSEGSPMIIKEALACNLPVVTVDVGDAAERIKDVRNCRLAFKNAEDIAKNISEVISLNQRSDGRDKLLSDGLTEKLISRRIIDIYLSVIMT